MNYSHHPSRVLPDQPAFRRDASRPAAQAVIIEIDYTHEQVELSAADS